MTTGLSDLMHSERGVFCIMALVCATVLVVTKSLAVSDWMAFVKYLTGVLVASKTVTTAVEVYTTKRPQISSEPEVPEPEIPSARASSPQ